MNKRNLQTIKECEEAGERLLKDFPNVKPFVNLAFSENIHKAVLFSWSWDEEAYIRQNRYDGVFAMLTRQAKEAILYSFAIKITTILR